MVWLEGILNLALLVTTVGHNDKAFDELLLLLYGVDDQGVVVSNRTEEDWMQQVGTENEVASLWMAYTCFSIKHMLLRLSQTTAPRCALACVAPNVFARFWSGTGVRLFVLRCRVVKEPPS